MPTLTIDPKATLHYYCDDFTDPWRPALAILLQHGFSRNGKFWWNWVPLLGRQYKVLRPDLRGLGQSQMAETDYEPSLDTFIDDARRILDREGVDRVVWVGESFGGIVGLKFAHALPERTRALVLVNTPCRLPRERRHATASSESWDDMMRKGGVGAWSSSTINMRLDPRYAPDGLKEWYIREMDQTPANIGRKLQAYLDTLDFSPHLKEIKVPTLLLTGDQSPTAKIDQQEYIASQIPNCKLAVLPNVGHGINATHPEWCVEQLREFLAGID